MKTARVIGTLVSTIKHETHRGYKLMFVQPVNEKGQPLESAFLAIDAVQAGVGDLVLVMEEGKGARQIMKRSNAPCEAIIVGIVDKLEIEETRRGTNNIVGN